MTLVVDLGLERFFYDNPDSLPIAVASLVEQGYTTLVREIVAPSEDAALAQARVLEVRRHEGAVQSRWLDAPEAKSILSDVRKAYAKHDTYASFSWSELDTLPAYNVQPLALTLDGAEKPPPEGILLPGVEGRVRVVDLARSIRNWASRNAQARVATALHKLAQKHRLIVHSA